MKGHWPHENLWEALCASQDLHVTSVRVSQDLHVTSVLSFPNSNKKVYLNPLNTESSYTLTTLAVGFPAPCPDFVSTLIINGFVWNENQGVLVKHYASGGNKVQKAIISFKVKVKVTRSLTLMSFERAPSVEYACQIWSLYLFSLKVIAKVKVDDRQTNKQTPPPPTHTHIPLRSFHLEA